MTTRIKLFDLILFVIFLSMIFGICYDVLKKMNRNLQETVQEVEVHVIDWHDWKLIDKDSLRIGLGEHGQPAYLPFYPAYTKDINDTVGYNGYLSDKIALNRSLKDLRPTA